MDQVLMDKFCYIHVRGNRPGSRIGMAQYGDSGYFRTTLDLQNPELTPADVDELVTHLNERLGISEAVRQAMELGTMFGWQVPGARPAVEHFGALPNT